MFFCPFYAQKYAKKISNVDGNFRLIFFSTIYILGAAGGTPRIKKFPKMAPEAFKWSNLNLQTLFGAYLCDKTTRFGVGTFGGVVSTTPPHTF